MPSRWQLSAVININIGVKEDSMTEELYTVRVIGRDGFNGLTPWDHLHKVLNEEVHPSSHVVVSITESRGASPYSDESVQYTLVYRALLPGEK
jgi:hypothetical protein